MRKFAYIRVSTEDQSFDRQMQVFKEHGITIDKDRIKTEKQSGKNVTGRDVLLKLLNETLESGDVLYVSEFSRLARSVRDMLDIVDQLNKKGIQIVSLKEKLDTRTENGRFVLTILSAVNEFERNIIRERQAEGIRAAREKGIYLGRKKIVRKDFSFWYERWINREVTATTVCRTLEISRNTFYRMVREYELNHNIDRNTAERIDYDSEKADEEIAEYLEDTVSDRPKKSRSAKEKNQKA